MAGYPQNVSAALHFLRESRISVSVARSSPLRDTLWFVATYPRPFDARGLVELAASKGFGRPQIPLDASFATSGRTNGEIHAPTVAAVEAGRDTQPAGERQG